MCKICTKLSKTTKNILIYFYCLLDNTKNSYITMFHYIQGVTRTHLPVNFVQYMKGPGPGYSMYNVVLFQSHLFLNHIVSLKYDIVMNLGNILQNNLQ